MYKSPRRPPRSARWGCDALATHIARPARGAPAADPPTPRRILQMSNLNIKNQTPTNQQTMDVRQKKRNHYTKPIV